MWLVSAFGGCLDAASRFTRELPLPFEFGHTGGMVMTLVTLVIIARHYRTLGLRHAIVLSFMPIMMPLATFIEPHIQGIDLHYPFILTEIIIVYTQHHLDMELQIEKDEVAETRSRIAMATGRMKPHYLYNVLTTIYYLCETDPIKAQRAIGTFSEYLRATLETLERQQLVNFSWELGEIRHYLELEKLRFGDRLRIDYDIEAEDFMVPPLSIQPLVENAVKHGIAPKEEGGTVRIVSRRLSDGGAQIRIRDDGAGFDIGELGKLDETHEGIANVRERIRLEVGGDMTITSAPGKGTTVVVTIRPEEAARKIKTT
jgi:sensor histidine kinase YesM